MNQYRVFVCTKKRSPDDPEGCCCDAGALDVYRAFQEEIARLQLEEKVKVCKSGCLDCCESGAVAMVYRPNGRDFAWLPTKLRVKLRKWLFPNRHTYGNLTSEDVSAIAESHLAKDKPLKRLQISTTN